MAPMKLVARLNARKVRADVPLELHARAHRVASRTAEVNSASEKIVNCTATVRIKILVSGL